MAKNVLDNILGQYNTLCGPARFYVLISLFSIVLMGVQNLGNSDEYCIGLYKCHLNFPTILMFVGKILYVLFWTIVLNGLCETKYTNLAWFLVLLPFVGLFIILGLYMLVLGGQVVQAGVDVLDKEE